MKPRRNIANFPGRTALLIGAVALFAIVGYSVYAALPLLEGPSLHVTTLTKPDGITSIQGSAARVSYLQINDAAIPLGEDGSFSVERAYPPGYTAITLIARDRFGRTITKSFSAVTGKILTANATTTL